MSTTTCTPEVDVTPPATQVDWTAARNFAYSCLKRQMGGIRGLDIEDVVQNIMIKVVRLHNKGELRGPVERLISGIVHNHVRDELRALNRRNRRIGYYLDSTFASTDDDSISWEPSDQKSLGDFTELECRTVVDAILMEFPEEEQKFFKSVIAGEVSASSTDYGLFGTRDFRYRRFLKFRDRVRQELSL